MSRLSLECRLEMWRKMFGLPGLLEKYSRQILWIIKQYLKIVDEQRQIYYSGIWTCDLRIDAPALYQLS